MLQVQWKLQPLSLTQSHSENYKMDVTSNRYLSDILDSQIQYNFNKTQLQNHLIHQSINQSINQSTDQRVDQMIDRWIIQMIDQSISQSN